MTTPMLRPLVGSDAQRRSVTDAGWLQWLSEHIDAAWRPGEWDRSLWLFTGDLDSDRTAAWRCRTPGCPTAARGFNGRCSSCRRSRSTAGVCEEEFDRAPRRRPTRPVARGGCMVPDCQGECIAAAYVSDTSGPGAAPVAGRWSRSSHRLDR
jgi:hypothetical protein